MKNEPVKNQYVPDYPKTFDEAFEMLNDFIQEVEELPEGSDFGAGSVFGVRFAMGLFETALRIMSETKESTGEQQDELNR